MMNTGQLILDTIHATVSFRNNGHGDKINQPENEGNYNAVCKFYYIIDA